MLGFCARANSRTNSTHMCKFLSWAHLQNCEKLLLASSCLSVCSHGTTQLPLEDFHDVIFEYFSKIC